LRFFGERKDKVEGDEGRLFFVSRSIENAPCPCFLLRFFDLDVVDACLSSTLERTRAPENSKSAKDTEERISLFFRCQQKNPSLTIFPAAVGLSAAAMFSRYLPLRAMDFLTISFPPEARSTVFHVEVGKRGRERKRVRKQCRGVPLVLQCSLHQQLTLGRRKRPQRDPTLPREDPGLHGGLYRRCGVGHGGLRREWRRGNRKK
jgi:hypothetical protein